MVIIVYQKFGQALPQLIFHHLHPPPTRHGQNSRVANAGLVDPMDEPMSSNLIEKNHPTEDNSVSFPLGQSSSCEAACSIIQLYLIMVTMSSILFWCDWPESNRHTRKREILSLLCLPISPQSHFITGAQGETRTLKIRLLRPACIPIPSPGQSIFGAG